jgi:hypothetical protein
VAAVLGAALLASVALAGCGSIDAALGQQVAIVRFKPGATLAELIQARHACARAGHLSVPKNPSKPGVIRYSLGHGTTGKQLAALQSCLQHFPDVTGVAIQDTAGRDL